MKFSLNIKQRLSGFMLLSLIFVATVAVNGYWAIPRLTSGMVDIVLTASAIRNHKQSDAMRMALHNDVFAALQAGLHKDEVEKQTVLRDVEEHAAIFRENMAKNAALPLSQDFKEVLQIAQPALEAYITSAESIVKLAVENPTAAYAQLSEFKDSSAVLADPMAVLSELMEESVKVSQEAADKQVVIVRNTIVSTMVLALLVLSIISWLLIRSITRPLLGAVKLAHTVASGDLTSVIEIKSRDETGKMMQALKDMNDSLVKIVGNVRGSVDAITLSAKEIATGNSDLSQRTEEQASSLQETASSMEELSATVKHNAENAKQANQLTLSARDVAVKGGDIVSKVVTTMASINDSSNKIVDIISVIEGIAFQTNILALNAAVEAARAGEQGRGFAVVAAEVRTLAQRSAAAAKEIKALIDDSVGKVKGGTKLVDEAGKTMDEIVTAVRRMTDIMAEISAASSEQSSGIDQVNQAINQMDQATQQNAALVEEAAAAAEAMKEEAENLTLSVSVFKLNGHSPANSVIAKSPPIATNKLSTLRAPPKKQETGEWEEF
ncbi:MAG: methyl-accepting chemotaxis protein [Gallionellaceae bacterium]|nr:methyl-accepting chemotaxis protein [Gallionellaceae bacterium]